MANAAANTAAAVASGPAVARGPLGGGLPIQSRVAAAEAEIAERSSPPTAVKGVAPPRPSLGFGGLPIASRNAEAAAAGVAIAGSPPIAQAPPAPAKPALKGLPIASRVAVAAAEGSSPLEHDGKAHQKPQVASVAGGSCGGLSLKRRVNIEVDCPAQTVTTPLVRRGTRRRSRVTTLTSTSTPTASHHMKAAHSPTSLEGSLTPASHATTATSHSFVKRAMSRTDTQSTNSSVKWAPQALIRSWHGKLTEVYKIVTIVGEGRSGAVFIVQHKMSEKYFACKVLRKGDHDASALRSEIQTLRKLDHPNIVRLVETHEDGDTVFLLMELCHGGDLFDKIIDEQTVNEPTARLFARQMISALAYCHASGVIHRDVKPENFLLETEHPDCMTLKLADFGIATSARPHVAGAERTPASDRATRDGSSTDMNVGSLPYTAPEILRGRRAYASSDMWSVGVTIYVMLSGNLPFDDLPDRICSGEPPSFAGEVWNDVSEEAIDLLRQLLKPDPTHRLTAQQALAHDWFADCSPLPEVTPIGSSSSDEIDTSDTACLKKLASVLLKNLRRWRKMPKLRRIAIAAVAKRLEAQHDAHRLAETVYTFFSDTPDMLRCDRLVQVLGGSLGGPSVSDCFGMARTPSRLSLPGMLLSPTADAARTPAASGYRRTGSGSLTGLRVRERLKNSLRRLAGTPMHQAEVTSPEAEASMAELRHLVAALDGMKNGIVDFTLLVACLLPAAVYADERHISEAFALFDVQRRGRISAGDVRAAVKSQEADIRRFAAMVAQFDTNADGALDFEEFRAMVAGTN